MIRNLKNSGALRPGVTSGCGGARARAPLLRRVGLRVPELRLNVLKTQMGKDVLLALRLQELFLERERDRDREERETETETEREIERERGQIDSWTVSELVSWTVRLAWPGRDDVERHTVGLLDF